nr:MAG TPA: hypothetical protein [Caudoviricetes sp.]
MHLENLISSCLFNVATNSNGNFFFYIKGFMLISIFNKNILFLFLP